MLVQRQTLLKQAALSNSVIGGVTFPFEMVSAINAHYFFLSLDITLPIELIEVRQVKVT